MKKIIAMFILMMFLIGCGVQHNIIFNIPKIKTKDSKEIVEYVVRTIQLGAKHKIEVDYKTLSTYTYFEKDGQKYIEGKSILVDCKVKDKEYFIRIESLNNISNYHVALVEVL
jgi:hypothetical protein